jgi:hypothetical protein
VEIEERVFLLAIYKKKDDESLNDVIQILENGGLFSYKDGKKFLKSFRKNSLIDGENLTLIGLEKAKDAELEFKL